jgi:3-oxoacyl-[acyl-carrier protein] reductase
VNAPALLDVLHAEVQEGRSIEHRELGAGRLIGEDPLPFGMMTPVSSIAGIRAVGSSIPYCASKAALNNLTISLARALAPKIRVNAVAPGFITGRWLAQGLGPAYEAVKQHQERTVPLKRVCDPEDVAAAIVSLVTGSELVTGHVLPVEGGMLIAT